MGFDPVTGYVAASAVNAGLQGLLGGQEQGPTPRLFVANPYQQALQQKTQLAALKGDFGDMGYGSAYKQGMGQLSQMMADRGVRNRGGYYDAAAGNVLGQAMGLEAQNRQNWLSNLMNQQTQFVQGYTHPTYSNNVQNSPWQAYSPSFGPQAPAAPGGPAVPIRRPTFSGGSSGPTWEG